MRFDLMAILTQLKLRRLRTDTHSYQRYGRVLRRKYVNHEICSALDSD